MIAENVYFCDFRKCGNSEADSTAAAAEEAWRDVRYVAEGLQGLCVEIRSVRLDVLRQTERHVEDLGELLNIIEEVAFQAEIMAIEWERTGASSLQGSDVRQLLSASAGLAVQARAALDQGAKNMRHASRQLHENVSHVRRASATLFDRSDVEANGPLEIPQPC